MISWAADRAWLHLLRSAGALPPFLLLCLLLPLHLQSLPASETQVDIIRLPSGAVQPKVLTGADGAMHLIYLTGPAQQANVAYARQDPAAATFSPAVQVNSQPGSAIAIGTVRGPRLAQGAGGRIHVLWNGSDNRSMWYASGTAHDGFSTQRNLMRLTSGVDVGGGIAADGKGHVIAAWHTHIPAAGTEEGGRGVFIATSLDEGASFGPEARAWTEDTGACGCCSLAIGIAPGGRTSILYRSASGHGAERDLYLLSAASPDGPFSGQDLSPWQMNTCPLTTAMVGPATARGQSLVWETRGQIYCAFINERSGQVSAPIPMPGAGGQRHHPTIACAPDGRFLVAWDEGTGWMRGGQLAWQQFAPDGSVDGPLEMADGLPVWDYAAAWTDAAGHFHLIY